MSDELTAETETIQLYPPWKQAIARFQAEHFLPGHIILHEWLYETFGIEQPKPDTSLEVAERAKLAWLSQFKEFERVLLTEHQIALRSVVGRGYEVVPAHEQSRWSYREGRHEISKALSRMGKRLVNTNLIQLNGEQRKEHADYLAKFSQLKGMLGGSSRGVERKEIG